MKIVTHYQVAGHRFAVESSNDALWTLMTNYEPFRVEKGDVVFTLRIEQMGLRTEETSHTYQHIFTDQSEENMPRIEVYRSERQEAEGEKRDAGWLIRVSMVAKSAICCEMVCNADFTSGKLHIAEGCKDVRFCIDNALMLLYAFCTTPLKTLEMHAAVVVRSIGSSNLTDTKNEELGYLFLGHSGTGKSTHAQQWLQAFSDSWLLNDDNPILRIMNNGEVRVYGSPWSGKTPCYKNKNARVGGIIKLSQAPNNNIEKLTLPQAYAYMLSSASGLKIDKHMADNMYESIKHIITHIPCRHLNCLPNIEAAQVCWNGLSTAVDR